ncbi:MAG TPA: DHA2 family efflux MFS transporter permease subunit [Terriglobales bacterium]|jgi:DHA2 family multidrug resistance protein|nr:DHA2 family efflux MFS transporter permease subunit [Terriglobales bacterium]
MDRRAHGRVNPWIVTISVMLATFMEILDTTVVNVSIPHIAGNLAATIDEGTWVVTSYLVSNAIILPMSGWLANYMGRRRMLLACVAGFTAMSLCCGLATSLPMLIFFRVLQGLSGGGLQPLAQAILLESFPREKHGQAMAAFSIGILLAPILGPTFGGWITDNYSWRWIFYLNLPVGVFSLFMMSRFVFDPPYIKRAAGRVDLWGIGFLALGFGTLQVVLDTGQRKDWLSSDYIRCFAILCVLGLVAFVIRELTTAKPVVDLRVLVDRTFSVGVFLMSMLGFLLYASLVLLPIYLQTLLGYSALDAGLALSPRGVGSLVTTPLVGYLTSKADPRRLLVFGLVLGSITMFALARLNLNAGYYDILWPQVLQGVALSFLFIPLLAASMSRIAKEKMGNATSIFNLMRNIGGSTGIAVMTTFLARRNQVHHNHLIANITPGDAHTREVLEGMRVWFATHGSDHYTATRRALAALYQLVQRHAAMLSFVEAFWIMGALFLVMLPFVVLLRNPRAKPSPEDGTREREVEPAIPAESPQERLQPEENELLVVHH